MLIPETYVADLQLRLGLYRRLSALETRADIDAFAAELVDRFGELPPEVEHLLDVMEIKGFRRPWYPLIASLCSLRYSRCSFVRTSRPAARCRPAITLFQCSICRRRGERDRRA